MSVQLAIAFQIGTLIRLTAAFTREPTPLEIADGTADDADDWQPIDPDTVEARVGKVVAGVMDPMTITQHAYLNSPSDIVRDDVGLYHLDYTAVSANVGKVDENYWAYRFESTGTGQAADESRFLVAESVFP